MTPSLARASKVGPLRVLRGLSHIWDSSCHAVDVVVSVEGVDGEAAEEFGIEVGGFLRHDFAGEGDVFELVEGDGFDEEGDVGFAGFDEGDGFVGFAEVLDVAVARILSSVEAEEMVEDDGVELGYA